MSLPLHFSLRRARALSCAFALCSGASLGAASFAENRDYATAVKAFQDGQWGYAEARFAQFVVEHPKSERVPEAVLYQARAQFEQGRFDQAITLLTGRVGEAGPMADRYLYWIGEAQFANTNYAAAAEAFGRLARDFPESAKRLAASVEEAASRAKLGEWLRVIELLQKPDSPFQQAPKTNANNESVLRGLLLLAEAGLAQKDFSLAETALKPLGAQSLKPDLNWQRGYLLCRVQLGAGQTNDALRGSAELVTTAGATGRRDWLAESVSLNGEILERLGRWSEAAAAFQRNLEPQTPVEFQCQALLKIAAVTMSQNQLGETIQRIEQFLQQFTNAPMTEATAVALLTLGELHLKQHVTLGQTTAPTAGTNHLQIALGFLDRLVNSFSNSPFLGKAELARGWCFWVSNQMPESAAAFQRAVDRLPPSEDLGIAQYKLGDALFAQNDFAGAQDHYRAALKLFAEWPRLSATLRAPTLYQTLRASCATTNLAVAAEALEQILQLPAGGGVADSSVLLIGQCQSDAGQPEQARALFEKFLATFPDSLRRPEVELAIARTCEEKAEWQAAITHYDIWLARFTNIPSSGLRARAEFNRAWANSQAGNDTHALNLFTNFVARFPTNDLAPQAQWWVADYYFRQPGGFLNAEKNFKLLFQTWPASDLAYEARMMAGRAAMGWSGYVNALDHFTNLTSDLKCPPGVKAQALFAYGNVLMAMPSPETNRLANYAEAIRVFSKLQQEYPTSEIAILAWGEIGKCNLQMGDYPAASNAFARVVASTANVAARSEAQVALGASLEELASRRTGSDQQTLLKQALDAYLAVVYEGNIREGETRDSFWVKEAGLKAAHVTEVLGEWSRAEKLYRRLQELLPMLRPSLESRIKRTKDLTGNKP